MPVPADIALCLVTETVMPSPTSLVSSLVQRGGTDKIDVTLYTPGALARLGTGTSAPACVRGRVWRAHSDGHSGIVVFAIWTLPFNFILIIFKKRKLMICVFGIKHHYTRKTVFYKYLQEAPVSGISVTLNLPPAHSPPEATLIHLSPAWILFALLM